MQDQQRSAEFVDDVDKTVWTVDMDFLSSNWTCIWGRGCKGILDSATPDLQQGCCSVGAELFDHDEGMRVAALAATIGPDRFQFHAEALDGVFVDETRTFTRIVKGACIFLNRPGFAGGAGCALHLAALDDGDSPIDWKPAVCWQLPFRIDRPTAETATLRRWERRDWGPEGADMAWCCTEEPETLVGEVAVVDSLALELEAIVGPEVMVQIRTRLATLDEP